MSCPLGLSLSLTLTHSLTLSLTHSHSLSHIHSLSLSLSFPLLRMVVQDIEESLFRTFLEYLYGKRIDIDNTSIDELIELLAISDRYEARKYFISNYCYWFVTSQTVSLRGFCEKRLSELITNKTVFQLLIAADQFSARQLRVSSICVYGKHVVVILHDVVGHVRA